MPLDRTIKVAVIVVILSTVTCVLIGALVRMIRMATGGLMTEVVLHAFCSGRRLINSQHMLLVVTSSSGRVIIILVYVVIIIYRPMSLLTWLFLAFVLASTVHSRWRLLVDYDDLASWCLVAGTFFPFYRVWGGAVHGVEVLLHGDRVLNHNSAQIDTLIRFRVRCGLHLIALPTGGGPLMFRVRRDR